MLWLIIIFASLSVAFPQDRLGCQVRTIAGPTTTDAGDGGPALSAQFFEPGAIAVADDGSIYIADTGNHKVRRISPNGIVETVAGTGIRGFGGDGGPATEAFFNTPSGVALDRDGNLYIADRNNNRIRKVGLDGVITTIAGSGVRGYDSEQGPALEMAFDSPGSVVVLSDGRILIGDLFNNRILELHDGLLQTVAGIWEAQRNLNAPNGDDGPALLARIYSLGGVIAGRSGDYYFMDLGAIRHVGSDGIVHTVVTYQSRPVSPADGEFLRSGLGMQSFSVDLDGQLLIATGPGGFLWKLEADGSVTNLDRDHRITTTALSVSSQGQLLALDALGVIHVEPGKVPERIAGAPSAGFSGDGGAATAALLSTPTALAAADGVLYVADAANRRIREIDSDGVISTFAGSGVIEADHNPDDARALSFVDIQDIAADLQGNLWITDRGQSRVHKVTPGGNASVILGPGVIFGGRPFDFPLSAAGTYRPTALGVDKDGNVFFSDSTFTNIYFRMISFADQYVRVRAALPLTPTRYLRTPWGGMVAISGHVTASLFYEVRPDGSVQLIFQPNSIFPIATAAYAPDGTLYFSNFDGLYRRELDGRVGLIWGRGALGDPFGPDARPGFSDFSGMTADAAGNLYFAHQNRIRMLEGPDACPAIYISDSPATTVQQAETPAVQ